MVVDIALGILLALAILGIGVPVAIRLFGGVLAMVGRIFTTPQHVNASAAGASRYDPSSMRGRRSEP